MVILSNLINYQDINDLIYAEKRAANAFCYLSIVKISSVNKTKICYI